MIFNDFDTSLMYFNAVQDVLACLNADLDAAEWMRDAINGHLTHITASMPSSWSLILLPCNPTLATSTATNYLPTTSTSY